MIDLYWKRGGNKKSKNLNGSEETQSIGDDGGELKKADCLRQTRRERKEAKC